MRNTAGYDKRMWALAQGQADDALERHIATCDACQRELTTLRELARYTHTTGGVDLEPPAMLVSQMAGLLRRVRPDLIMDPRPSATTQIRDVIRRVAASLVFDSATSAQPVGLRGSGDRRTRQLVFESDVADLDLELAASEDDDEVWALNGQLGMETVPAALTMSFFPMAQTGASGSRKEDVADAVRMDITSDGYFRGALPSGNWTAVVEIGDATVSFGEIQV